MNRRCPKRRTTTAAALIGLLWPIAAATADDQPGLVLTPAPPDAAVYFITPANGAVVRNPITIQFGLRGMGVAPAAVDQANTGHHHLVIDSPLPDMRLPIPMTDLYRHFGGGQTEFQLELPPGKHTLQLLLGDFRHVPHDPPIVSERIEITVE